MNKKLLYIYLFLVIITVLFTLVMWALPNTKKENQSHLNHYLNIQPLVFNNGGTGFLSTNFNSEVVALDIIFKGGSSIEPLNYKGISHILANMLVSSNKNDYIRRYLKKYSIGFSVHSGLDNIIVKVISTRDNISHMFYILNIIFNHTNFDIRDLKVIKDNTLLNLKLSQHYTSVVGINTLYKAIFNNDPHLTNIQGTMDTINAINIKSLEEAKKVLLTKNNIVVGASGNISKKELEDELNKIFSPLQIGKEIPFNSKSIKCTPDFINLPIKDTTNSDIYIVMCTPSEIAKEDLALGLVNHYLGRGFNSLLMEEVRVKRGLAYSINSSLINTLYGNFWLIKVTTENAKVQETIEVIKSVLKQLEEKPYKNSDIKKIKSAMVNSYLLNFADNQSIANTLAKEAYLGSSIDSIYNIPTYINNISIKNIDNVVARYVTSNNLLIIVAGAKI